MKIYLARFQNVKVLFFSSKRATFYFLRASYEYASYEYES